MKKYTKKTEEQVAKEILESIAPFIKKRLNEINSQTLLNAADRAESFGNRNLAQKFRDYADEVSYKELNANYADILDIKGEIEFASRATRGSNLRKFFVAYYVPSKIYVLIFCQNKAKCAIVRIGAERLHEISNPQILNDIASAFNRKPIAKSNVDTINTIVEYGKSQSKEIANQVSALVGEGCHLNWRCFYGDEVVRGGDEDGNTRAGKNYQYIAGQKIQGVWCYVVKYLTAQPGYSIFYILLSYGEDTIVIRVAKYLKEIQITGYGYGVSIYHFLKANEEKTHFDDDITVPSRKSCDTRNCYRFFNDVISPLDSDSPYKSRVVRCIFNFISTNIDFVITYDTFENEYERVMDNQKNGTLTDDDILDDEIADEFI